MSTHSNRTSRVRSLTGFRVVLCAVACLALPQLARAQDSTGAVRGRVTQADGKPAAGVVVLLEQTRLGASTDDGGTYRIGGIAPGRYMVLFRRVGLATDSAVVFVSSRTTATLDIALQSQVQALGRITISASPRLNESKEQGLERRKAADNIVTVLSGDDIRALPNANAAEAVARIPGISTERDEGEGKFVQIRGTEPRLSNVLVNGVHIPGTQTGSRAAKLDDVPTDILGAIEVTKTLTANQDADAIGGTVNLISKMPEGAPRGYFAGQYGQATLLNRTQGQGSLTYGGRVGENRRLGFLLGGTYDHNNRGINDLELAWDVNDKGAPIPVEWDQRDYVYDRTRFGANATMDYHFDDGSTMYVRGLWSKFQNFGKVYRYDLATGGDSAQAPSGTGGIGTNADLVRSISNRTPVEQLFGVSAGGKKMVGATEVNYAANFSGTRSASSDYRGTNFTASGVNFRYDGANRNYPSYSYLSSADQALATTPTNFALASYSSSAGRTRGNELGGQADATTHYVLGDAASRFQYGVKYRDESRDNINLNRSFAATSPLALNQFMASFSDPSFYQQLATGYVIGAVPDHGATSAFENANPSMFRETTRPISDSLSNFTGGEKVSSAYAMNTVDIGRLRINTGLRMEHTAVQFSGNVATTPGDATGKATGPVALRRVNGSQGYTDLFPSVQLRYELDTASNIRVAVTRGIARANYSDLAPHLTGEVCPSCALKFSNLSAGNPELKPQHAWSVDVLGERFISSTGVVSAGVFYKNITDFIYKRQFIYNGPATEFAGYYGTQPQNGGSGSLVGAELDYSQRLQFLPGVWSGLGFDVNWTQVDSRAQLLADTAKSASTLGSPTVRNAPLPRQAKSIGNFALTYDGDLVSARAAWQYQGANIYGYGDGSATPSGDNYVFAHSQIDASVTVNMTRDVSLQLQGLNLNNAVFGFYNGTPGSEYSAQREYYGRSLIMAVKYGFGALPGSR